MRSPRKSVPAPSQGFQTQAGVAGLRLFFQSILRASIFASTSARNRLWVTEAVPVWLYFPKQWPAVLRVLQDITFPDFLQTHQNIQHLGLNRAIIPAERSSASSPASCAIRARPRWRRGCGPVVAPFCSQTLQGRAGDDVSLLLQQGFQPAYPLKLFSVSARSSQRRTSVAENQCCCDVP